ncbi:MAG: hypothetical protein CBARDMAM_2295 [uncultured Caballeronia sp.]|nr:MAG: hypothetical protein CBARDMAM_2295 [uncultured Caballeronia sp.]
MVLTREFVDLFEKHVPTMVTALVSVVGAVAMLLAIEPWIDVVSLGTAVHGFVATLCTAQPKLASTSE